MELSKYSVELPASSYKEEKGKKEEYLSIIPDNLQCAICIFLKDGSYEYINQYYLDYTGKKETEMKGMGWKNVIHPEDFDRIMNLGEDSAEAECTSETVFRIRRHDGVYKWFMGRITQISNLNGVTERWIGSFTDVNQFVEAEEKNKLNSEIRFQKAQIEKDKLFKEVQHRIKNNLQIIASLMNLQSYYISNEDTLELFNESKNRVRAIGLIHEKLYETKSLSELSADKYFENLVEYLRGTYQVRPEKIEFNYNLEPIVLKSDVIINLGLIANELISNSIKYAFPEGIGIISLSLKKEDGKTIFVIRDNGIGLPEGINLESPSTLGIQLIVSLADQIGGTMQFMKDNGTAFLIKF
jgi:PAS domain S-box-containing protein